MNQVLEAIEKRSSARAYSQQEVSKDLVDAIIKAGLQAPTATNRKEIRFSVVNGNSSKLEELNAEFRRLRNIESAPHNFYYEAPVLIMLSSEDGFGWSRLDAGIAVQTMALAAESLGLGSLIIGCVYDAMNGEKKEYFNSLFEIPEGYSFDIALAVGYKTDNKVPHDFVIDEQIKFID